MSVSPRLRLTAMTKRYPAVLANDAVSLSVMPGEIHAVLGENGAGKSTLMKLIYGAVQPDAGQIEVDGRVVTMASPKAARALGVSMVFQHFSLFDTLTVAENVWLGLERAGNLACVSAQMAQKAREYGLDIDPTRPVHTLSVGERQRVEIVRALLSNPRILILDEPTSVLTPSAVQVLFGTLRQLAAQGCSVVYISHKLHEIRELCSSCTVLRAGRVTGVCDPRQESDASLSRLMIGAEPAPLTHAAKTPGEPVLQVLGLSLSRADEFGTDLHGVSFNLCAGEVLGVAGISGNGQQELLRALSGEDKRAPSGSIRLFGQDVSQRGPFKRRNLGQHFVPEERLGRGAVPAYSLALNTLLTREESVGRFGWIDTRALLAQAAGIVSRFGVKASGAMAPAQSLSGGNLQKFIVGREVSAQPKLLIIAQPTWGVDVGAAAQIRAAILSLRDEGCAVLVLSEELDELFDLSDRLCVMAQGHLSDSLDQSQATKAQVGAWMGGSFLTALSKPGVHQQGAHAAA